MEVNFKVRNKLMPQNEVIFDHREKTLQKANIIYRDIM